MKEGGWDDEVSEKSLALRHLQSFLYRREADPVRSSAIGVTRDGKTSRSRTSGADSGVQ